MPSGGQAKSGSEYRLVRRFCYNDTAASQPLWAYAFELNNSYIGEEEGVYYDGDIDYYSTSIPPARRAFTN